MHWFQSQRFQNEHVERALDEITRLISHKKLFLLATKRRITPLILFVKRSKSSSKIPLDLSEKLSAQEKKMIEAALRESAGRVFGPSGAATKLGIARSTLESRIRSLKISKNSFKDFAETIPRPILS
jgi:DNA-binding NtrC family response regulator